MIGFLCMLTFASCAHSNPAPNIWWCNGGKDFAHWIFPDLLRRQYTSNKKYNECDIVVGCSIATTAGSNVYVNGERKIAVMTELHENDVYLGPTGELSSMRNALWVPVPAVRSVLSAENTERAFEKTQSRKRRNEFMAYIQSNCVSYRENAFNLFAMEARRRNSKSPHAYGRCCGSFRELKIGKKTGYNHNTNRNIFKRYKFALVMENANYPGYVTEKIVNGFLGGAIPVYYGTTDIFKIFNKNAFVYYDVNNPAAAIEKVFYLNQNETAYKQVATELVLAPGAERHFSITPNIGNGILYHRIRNMLAANLNHACNTSSLTTATEKK